MKRITEAKIFETVLHFYLNLVEPLLDFEVGGAEIYYFFVIAVFDQILDGLCFCIFHKILR